MLEAGILLSSEPMTIFLESIAVGHAEGVATPAFGVPLVANGLALNARAGLFGPTGRRSAIDDTFGDLGWRSYRGRSSDNR